MFTALIPLKSDFTSGWETVKKANIVAATAESVGQKVSYLRLLSFYLFQLFLNYFFRFVNKHKKYLIHFLKQPRLSQGV